MNKVGCHANHCDDHRLYWLTADKRAVLWRSVLLVRPRLPAESERMWRTRPARMSTTNDREGPQRPTGLNYCLLLLLLSAWLNSTERTTSTALYSMLSVNYALQLSTQGVLQTRYYHRKLSVRPSVYPSVCLSGCDGDVISYLWPYRLDHLESKYTHNN